MIRLPSMTAHSGLRRRAMIAAASIRVSSAFTTASSIGGFGRRSATVARRSLSASLSAETSPMTRARAGSDCTYPGTMNLTT